MAAILLGREDFQPTESGEAVQYGWSRLQEEGLSVWAGNVEGHHIGQWYKEMRGMYVAAGSRKK